MGWVGMGWAGLGWVGMAWDGEGGVCSNQYCRLEVLYCGIA